MKWRSNVYLSGFVIDTRSNTRMQTLLMTEARRQKYTRAEDLIACTHAMCIHTSTIYNVSKADCQERVAQEGNGRALYSQGFQ